MSHVCLPVLGAKLQRSSVLAGERAGRGPLKRLMGYADHFIMHLRALFGTATPTPMPSLPGRDQRSGARFFRYKDLGCHVRRPPPCAGPGLDGLLHGPSHSHRSPCTVPDIRRPALFLTWVGDAVPIREFSATPIWWYCCRHLAA